MSTASGHDYQVAIAKQTAKGTAASTAEFAIPVFEADFNPVQDRIRHEVADGNAYRPGGFITTNRAEGRAVFASFPDSVSRLLHAHMGADAVTGAADPWTHTITRSATQPWHTVWVKRPVPGGTYQWDRFEDVRARGLDIMWASGTQLKVGLDMLGLEAVVDASAPTITTTNSLDNSEEYHTWAGSTLLLDIDATPAVTQVSNLQEATIRLAYEGMEPIYTDEVTPQDIHQGLWSVEFSTSGFLQDYGAYKATFFGSDTASDTGLSSTIVKGSLDFTFPVGPVANADREMTVAIPSVEFQMTAPAVDVSAGPVPVQITGILSKPASGEPVTFTVKNATEADLDA